MHNQSVHMNAIQSLEKYNISECENLFELNLIKVLIAIISMKLFLALYS